MQIKNSKKFFTLAILTLCLFKSGNAFSAQKIPDEIAVHCILGEARGTNIEEMSLIASALRNRGTTKGVHGCSVVFTKEDQAYMEQKRTVHWAAKVWQWAKDPDADIVFGATEWGSVQIDQDWIRQLQNHGYVETKRTKYHVYFKKPLAKQ